MADGTTDDLSTRVRKLFSGVAPAAIPDALTNSLMHTALFNTYLLLYQNNMAGRFVPHSFLPPELAPFFDGLSVGSLSREELERNLRTRAVALYDFIRKARRDPLWFRDVTSRLLNYQISPLYDPQKDVFNQNLPAEESLHSGVTAGVAYLLVSDLWRAVSLAMVGKGKYISGITPSGQVLSKAIREPPDNKAAFNEALVKWQRLAGHALSFFENPSIDKLVQDGDEWSDIDVIKGYPNIASADKTADNLLRYAYEQRERYVPLPHQIILSDDKGKPRYKGGQSIASITIIDLDSPQSGFHYLIRHTDNTVVAGKIFLPNDTGRFRFMQSNLVQHMNESTGPVLLDPFLGVCLLVAAIGRDMMVYKDIERTYRIERSGQPNAHTSQGSPIKWLPIEHFIYNTESHKAQEESERAHELSRIVTPYYVPRHKRRLLPDQQPSPKQLALAASVTFKVPEGYTFVRGHPVGGVGENMVQHYKSRSAASVLFGSRSR
ncbi:hypothetical protein HYV83_01855 [Candidatus Woesearchaeota archaeon]|nr:hypothetical protein [Candidatus Woesearchaeota archaeon]